jgi:tRNA pseudouridine55 synthase
MTAISGILLVDKPQGLTSHDVVLRVRRRARGARVGHSGTLDPAATGLLIVLLGKATKLSEALMNEGKEYEAVIELGRETDTGDATGRTLREHGGPPPEAATVARALEEFVGEIDQVPPMVSALKVGGRRLYDLARVGRTVERAPRRVRVDRIELRAYEPPRVSLRVACGRGMYLRALAADLGAALGVGGTLASLRRTRVGPFSVERAVALGDLEAAAPKDAWRERVITLEDALAHIPGVVVAEEHTRRVLRGQSTGWSEVVSFPEGLSAGSLLRVLGPDGRLLAMGRAHLPGPARAGHGPESAPRDTGSPFRLERVLADPGDV